jgi:hypothetical protein
MTENIGNVYPLTIPSITDNADIQTAFRLYHYGSDTTTPGTPDNESLAGYLGNLETTKVDVVPVTIPSAANLNLTPYTTTGFYSQTNNAAATAGTNYPAPYAGLLTVVNDGNVVFQQYQVVGASESGSTTNSENKTYWRYQFAGAWRPWRTFIDNAQLVATGDIRYYTQSAANSLFYSKTHIDTTFFTKAEALASQYLLENVQTGSYTLALSDVNKVVAMDNAAAATITVPNNTSVAFPVGTVINIYRMTDQPVDVVGDLGVTVRNAGNIYEQYTEISLRKRATNEWVASGNIIPA